MFLFTLNSNGRSKVKKFDNIYKCNTSIYEDKDFYSCIYDSFVGSLSYCFQICQIGTKRSYIDGPKLVNGFKEIETTTLTGNCFPERFTTKRIIIVQMK